MDVSLEYLRPFYPLNEDEIGESPFGRPFVFSSPITDNRDWEFEIERLLEEVGKNHDIPFEITLVGNHHIASKHADRGIQEHWEVFRRIMNSAGDLIAVKKKRLPVTERIAKEILSIPLFYDLTLKQVRWIASVINSYFK